ncbi:PEP-CTERM sorting domain-containing protein, partial [Thiobacillus sp.]
MLWNTAYQWVAALSFSDGINVYDSWRLPTVEPVNGISFNYNLSYDGSTDYGYNITSPNSELAYMFYVNLGNSADFNPSYNVGGCYVSSSDTCLDNVGPFVNLQPSLYWSDTQYAPNISYAWVFGMPDGLQWDINKANVYYAWAVSPGDVGVAAVLPEANTWAMLLAGLGLIGWRARRRGSSAFDELEVCRIKSRVQQAPFSFAVNHG